MADIIPDTAIVATATALPPAKIEGNGCQLSVDLAGNLRTVPSGTQTVSGTVNQGTAAALASAWPVKVTDGVTAAAVSTAGAVSTQVSDVTAVTNLMGAANQRVVVALQGRAGVGFLLSGTWTGTVVVDLSADGGTTWTTTPQPFYDYNFGVWRTSVTANGTYAIPGSGVTHAAIRNSALSSGTIVVTTAAVVGALLTSPATFADGGTKPPVGNMIGGVDIGSTPHYAVVGRTPADLGSGAWMLGVLVSDGANSMVFKAASTPAVAADPAAVVQISPNSPQPVGIADTLFASGSAASPAAGAAIATLTTPAAGTYRLDVECYEYTANVAAGVAPDMELRKGAAVQISKLGGISGALDGATPGVAPSPTRLKDVRITLDGSTSVSINATAGLVATYVAQLVATRVF